MIRLCLFCLFIIGSTVQAKDHSCAHFLNQEAVSDSDLSSTDFFLSYIGSLLEQNIVGPNELKVLSDEIELHGRLINIVPADFTQSAYRIYHELMAEHLKQEDLDLTTILSWIFARNKKIEKVKEGKAQAQKHTRIGRTEMQLLPVKHGSFVYTYSYLNQKKQKDVKLTYDFEAMPTSVTQWMWFSEMHENTVNPADETDIIPQEDFPIVNVTWCAAAAFANHMSRKHGLKEVYDFSGVKFKAGTRMEDGTLDIERSDTETNNVKVFGGDIYKTEGFRLPTITEQVYMASDRGRSKTDYFSGVNVNNLKDYAWFELNSDKQIHRVAELNAMVIDGFAFYDLHGNVSEWSSDFSDGQNIISGENPQKNDSGPGRYTHGAAFNYGHIPLHAFSTGIAAENQQRKDLGFRLVRTIKKKVRP